MTDPNRKAEFLQKLQALLSEYSVSIDAGYEGDTHGIHDEHISINHRPDPKSWKEEEWLRIDHQIHIDAFELAKHL